MLSKCCFHLDFSDYQLRAHRVLSSDICNIGGFLFVLVLLCFLRGERGGRGRGRERRRKKRGKKEDKKEGRGLEKSF